MQGGEAIWEAGEVMPWVGSAYWKAVSDLLVEGQRQASKADSLEREISRLDNRIQELTDRYLYERERADRATDALLASKGLPTIMPEPVPREMDVGGDPYAREDPQEVAKMLKAMGLERTHAEA